MTPSEEILKPDQSTSCLQNWNLAGFCRMPLLPSRVRYSAVWAKHSATVCFQSRLSSTCLCTSCTWAVTRSNLVLYASPETWLPCGLVR